MPINSADPDLLADLGTTLTGDADDVELWGLAASNTMYAHGYAYGATAVAGSTYGSASWLRWWASSLQSRSSMLAAYEAIALIGAGGAGGAGAALGAGRQWAVSETSPLPFEEWWQEKMAAIESQRRGAALADRVIEGLRHEDYGALWAEVDELIELDDPQAATGFFNRLGVAQTAALPNNLIGMTSGSDVHLRATVGHPADLISLLSRQLAAASHTGALRFSGSTLIEADLATDVTTLPYLTGYGAEYLLMAPGFNGEFLADAVATFLPYVNFALTAQQILVSNIDGQFSLDPRDFLLPNVVAAGASSQLLLLLIDAGQLDALLEPDLSYNEPGGSAVIPLLEEGIGELAASEPALAHYVIGSVIDFVGDSGARWYVDIVAASVLLIMPQLSGIMNGASGEAWLGESGGREVLVSEDQLAAAFRAVAANDAATAVLYEGVLAHYGRLIEAAGNDPASLNRVAVSLADLSALLTTSIADAKIADARERDERMAATIALIDTLSGLVPLAGAQQVGGKLAANLVKTTYAELVDRGLEMLETNYEDEARAQVDAINQALLFSYTEFLTLGYLSTQGPTAVADSIDSFFTASPHLDPEVYDFSDGGGGLSTNLSDRQRQAYGEWILFASADEEINNAISRLLAVFLSGLPHYD